MRRLIYNAVFCGGVLLFCGGPVVQAYGQNLTGSQNPRVPAPTGTVVGSSWVIEPGTDGVGPLGSAPISSLPPTLVGRDVVAPAGAGPGFVSPNVVSPNFVGPTVVGPSFGGPTVVGPAPRQTTTYRVYPSAGAQVWRPVTPTPAPVAARPTRPIYLGRGLIGQPKVYVEGQPFRNALRFLTP